MRKALIMSIMFIFILTPALVYAGDKGPAMVVDTLFVRPVGIAAIAVGTAVFIVSLPFAALSDSVDHTAQELVVKPVKFTFSRPVGDFYDDNDTYSVMQDP